jgi:FlaG/FlaF family flagellin (archaellin)
MGGPNIGGLLSDEGAVSPVIGIVLMVAITVILASLVGVFAVGTFGDNSQEAPQIVFQYDYDGTNDELTIRHRSGDVVDGATLTFRKQSGTDLGDWSGAGEVRAGSTATLGPGGSASPSSVTSGAIDSGDTVLIVWNQQREGEDTAVIGTWEGPDA